MANCSSCGAFTSDDKRNEVTGVLECRKCGAVLTAAEPAKEKPTKGNSGKDKPAKNKGKQPKGKKEKPKKTAKGKKGEKKTKEKKGSTPKKGKGGKDEDVLDEVEGKNGEKGKGRHVPTQEDIDNFDFDSMEKIIQNYKSAPQSKPNIPIKIIVPVVLVVIIMVVVVFFLGKNSSAMEMTFSQGDVGTVTEMTTIYATVSGEAMELEENLPFFVQEQDTLLPEGT